MTVDHHHVNSQLVIWSWVSNSAGQLWMWRSISLPGRRESWEAVRRAGPDWVPATIVARLGPHSYLVETQDKRVWRRHVDHVKLRTVSPVSQPPSAPEPESECVWDSAGSGPRGSLTNSGVAESEQEQAPDSNDSVRSEQELSSIEDSQSDTNSIPHTTASQPSVIVPSQETSRYLQRERQAPAYHHFKVWGSVVYV